VDEERLWRISGWTTERLQISNVVSAVDQPVGLKTLNEHEMHEKPSVEEAKMWRLVAWRN